MITFKQYLSEDVLTEAMIKKWFTKGVDVDTAMSVLNTYAKDGLKAIKNGGLVYRGFSHKPDGNGAFVAMDSSTGKRTSRDTDNLYQLMLGASSALSEYADRSNSFICSTSRSTADSYGNAFVMVPLDGTNIVMSKHSDYFHQSFSSPIYNGSPDGMYDLSKFIMSAGVKRSKNGDFTDAKEIDAALSKLSPEALLLRWDIYVVESSLKFKDSKLQSLYDYDLGDTYDSTKFTVKELNILKKLEPEIAAGRFTSSKKSIPLVYELLKANKNKRFTALSSEIMTPTSAGLTLVRYGEPLKRNVECWFSGKCIAISYPVFAQILARLKEQDFPIDPAVFADWNAYIKKYGKEKTKLAKSSW